MKMTSSVPSPVVKGPGGKYMKLSEGMREHFRNLCGDWGEPGSNGETTIMCLALFSRDYISPVGNVSGAVPLKDNVLATIKGDEAEEKIFDILKEFGEKYSQPMFVLSKLKFTEFIKYCLRPGLELQEEPTRFQAEVDFAIVHLKIGVILVEVKVANKWPDSKPFDQLQKGKKLIRGLLPEQSLIPVYKVIALPNMDGHGFPKDEFVSLKKLNVDSCDEFEHWMKEHFSEEGCTTQEKSELLTLLHKLVGQKTVVASSLPERIEFTDEVREDKVLSNLSEKILNQSCLKQSFQCQTAKEKKKGKGQNKSCLATGCCELPNVVKTANRPDMAKLSEQVSFLNMEQLGVWEGPNHQLISGVPGSGKTILLQYKALECAKKGEKVIMCVPSPLHRHYEAFFAANDIHVFPSEVTIYSFDNFDESLQLNQEKFHLFVDELQVLCGYQAKKPKRNSLNDLLLSQKGPEECYCWFAYDETQFMTSGTHLGSLLHEKHKFINYQGVVGKGTAIGIDGTTITPVNYYLTRTLSYIEQLQLMQSHHFQSASMKTAMRCTE